MPGEPVVVAMLLENHPYPQDTRVRQEAEALARAGHDVTVLAPRGRGQAATERIAGVTVRRYRLPGSSETPWAYLLEYGVAHAQLLVLSVRELARGADVLHLHNPPDTLFMIGLLARAIGRDVVFDQHDSTLELFEEKFGTFRLARRALLAVQRASLRTASAVIVTNQSQRRLALQRARRRPRTLAVVRNGPARHRLAPAEPRRPGALADPRLVYVGELAPQDGVLALPGVLAHPALERATLTVVGDGPSREELAARCLALGVQDRVRLTGWVDEDEVFRLIREADIAIDPAPCNALNHISTMMKIAEYLAGGRPVVAYRLAETESTAAGAALYAECGDVEQFVEQIRRVAQSADLRSRLARAGRDRAAELVWERSETVLLDVYSGLACAR